MRRSGAPGRASLLFLRGPGHADEDLGDDGIEVGRNGISDLDLAVLHREPRLNPQQKLSVWRSYRKLLGSVPVGVDLLVSGWEDAAHMAGSRWHVMGDIVREGKVLYVAR